MRLVVGDRGVLQIYGSPERIRRVCASEKAGNMVPPRSELGGVFSIFRNPRAYQRSGDLLVYPDT